MLAAALEQFLSFDLGVSRMEDAALILGNS